LETDPPGLPSLRETVQALTQYRPGSPLWERNRPTANSFGEMSNAELCAHTDRVMAELDALPSPDWEAIAQHGNVYLGPEWPAPPWSGDQWATVAMVLALAQEDDSHDVNYCNHSVIPPSAIKL
jgi:hypothetical protein